MDIKVIGSNGRKSKLCEEIVREAVYTSGIDAKVEKISDPMKIAEYCALGSPAVVIDGEVKSVGKVPAKAEVVAWILEMVGSEE